MASEFRCIIPGPAVAQARCRAARTARGVRVYDAAPVANYKAYAKTLIAQSRPPKLMDGAVSMHIDIYVQRPPSWSKKRIHACTKPDADNYAKLIMDCCEGLVYTNDSRVVELIVRKRLAAEPAVSIAVESVGCEL